MTIKHYIKRAPIYGAAAALVAASATMNVRFGYSLGENDIDRLVWTGASIGRDILKAASPVALVWAWHNRSVLTGLAAISLMGVTITYSSLAAIGFTASARDSMSAGREGQAQIYQRASSAYEAANSELATLGLPRPIAALEARISSILANPLADTEKGPCGTIDGDYTKEWCPVVTDLKVELAKAKRKAKLEGQRDVAKSILDKTPSIEEGDPQAATVAAFITKATGREISPGSLKPWLAGIAALLVELGSTLGFLVAGAGRNSKRVEAPTAIETPTGLIIEHETLTHPVGDVLRLTHETGISPVDGIERRADGTLRVSQRRLSDALGKSRRTVSAMLEDLVIAGKIAIEATTGGTLITMLA